MLLLRQIKLWANHLIRQVSTAPGKVLGYRATTEIHGEARASVLQCST